MRKSATAAIAAGALVGSTALGTGIGVLSANAATCTTSHSYSHSVTARGTQTQTWIVKHTCGRDYTETEHHVTHSRTGATTDMHFVKDMYRYPHWWKHETTRSVSAKGTVTYRVTNTSG